MRDAGLLAFTLLLLLVRGTSADQVDDMVQAEMANRHIPGLSRAIVRNGELLLAKGYGQASLELEGPATADSVYQIGSITKQFTATAVMLLAQDGKLAIDDPISKYLDVPKAWNRITVRHLLTHTSGIKSYTGLPEVMNNDRRDFTHEEVIKLMADRPLEFEPGSNYRYSNSGYFLLGMLIEKLSGESYGNFIRQRIFDPLEMRSTRPNSWQEVVKNRAAGYRWDGDRWRNADYGSSTLPFAAGTLLSTVEDLARWEAALTRDKILPRKTQNEMWTPARLNSGVLTRYGFGFAITEYRGHRVIAHTGAIQGFSTYFARFVDDKVAVIVLCNVEHSTPVVMSHRIASLQIPSLATPQQSIENN